MPFTQKKYHYCMVFFFLCFNSKLASALQFQTGVGGGIEYTSNAELAAFDAVEDTIATTFVGASLIEDVGPLVYGVDATLRRENYLNDTFADRSYFNLGIESKWEMIRDRFDWFLSDRFSQTPVVSTASETPRNTQDTNIFNFGANINLLISGRQTITITPAYRQYYYEVLETDNRQYSLAANWRYRLDRLLNLGLNSSIRSVDYFQQSLINTTFANAAIVLSGQPVRSNYTIVLGATTVTRDGNQGEPDQSETGFAGSVNLLKELSSRSTIEALISTDLTDTSTAATVGNPNDVQQTTDVVRNRVAQLTYLREDALLRTSITGAYRELLYSESKGLNRNVTSFDVRLGFPVTQLVSGGVFLYFENVDRPESLNDPNDPNSGLRNDKRFDFGATADVAFTQKLSANASVQYRTKESTNSVLNYDEFSVFVGLSYGIGVARGRSSPGNR